MIKNIHYVGIDINTQLWLFLFILIISPLTLVAQSGMADIYLGPPHKSSNDFFELNRFLDEGISISINELDDSCLSKNINPQHLSEAAEMGAKAAGWRVNQSARKSVFVELKFLAQKNDTVSFYQVEVFTGNSLTVGGEGYLENIGDLSARRTLEIFKNNFSPLETLISQLASSVASKYKIAVLRQRMLTPDPDQNPSNPLHN
jgi:hypothetical protein